MDNSNDIEILKRALTREKKARKAAEQILEQKSLELYESNDKLQVLNESLESEVEDRLHELKEREEQLRHLFENNPFPMLIYDYESLRIVDLNKPAKLFYGSSNDLVGKKVVELHPEDEQEDAALTQKRVLANDHIDFREWHHMVQNGESKPIELHSSLIYYLGRKSRLLLINDITERKKIEEEKNVNQRKYQELVEGASDVIFRSTMDGDFVYVNPTAVRITEYTEKELLQMNYLDLIVNDQLQKVKDFYEMQLQSGENTSYLEFAIKTKTGKQIWLGQNVNLRLNEKGESEANALARDITELKLARESLERSENKYRNILENLKLGILEVDLDGIITKAYPQFLELSGYSEEELIGASPLDLLLSPEHRTVMTLQSVKRSQGKSSVYEVELITKTGDKKWVIISGAPFYNEKGEIIGTVGIHLDISDRKRIEGELLAAKNLAEKSVKVKEMFMANMSHEIRTPMNAVLGMSRLLGRTELDNKQNEYVDALNFSAENLLVIINDILDFSKIESDSIELTPEQFDLKKICSDLLHLMRPKAEDKSILLEIEKEDLINVVFNFDKGRLNQVLTNLIGNAIKFTKKGQVTLKLSTLRQEDSNDLVKFEVIDTGIGISNENQERIFESFLQANESIERKFGGTGLGLAISKSLVSKMGGVLSVDSDLGKGSNFSFELDMERCDEVLVEVKVPAAIETDYFQGMKILLVEDNEINLFMAQTILIEIGCDVKVARNGKEAVELFPKYIYNAVLMDMRMPIMDGIEATQQIRANYPNIPTPIIALTANALKEDKVKCLEVGMNEFLTKPFEREDLIKTLSKYRAQGSENNAQKEKSYVDTTNLDKIAGTNEKFKTEMIHLFIKESNKELDALKGCVDSQDWRAVSEIAHKLKPSFDYLSINELRDLVRFVEIKFKEPNPEQHIEKLNDFIEKIESLRGQLLEY